MARERAADEHAFADLKRWRVLTKPRPDGAARGVHGASSALWSRSS
ncbi:hypothetical protein ABZ769_02795 [Streptomyces olivoreticuli]